MDNEKKKRILEKSEIQHFIVGANFDIKNVVMPLKINKEFIDNYEKIKVEHNGKILKCALNGEYLNIFYPKLDNNDNILYLDYESEQSTFLNDSKEAHELYKIFDIIN